MVGMVGSGPMHAIPLLRGILALTGVASPSVRPKEKTTPDGAVCLKRGNPLAGFAPMAPNIQAEEANPEQRE